MSEQRKNIFLLHRQRVDNSSEFEAKGSTPSTD